MRINGLFILFSIAIINCGCGTPKPTEMQLAAGVSLTERHPKPDLQKIQELVSAGKNVNEKGWAGETVLRTALRSGFAKNDNSSNYLKIVDYLLNHGADPNATSDIDVDSILMMAVPSSNKLLIEKLVSKGADINFVNAFGQSALSKAASAGNAELVEYFLARVTNIRGLSQSALVDCSYGLANGKNKTEKSEDLINYKNFQFAAIFEMLLKAGADINSADKRGMYALHTAIFSADPEIVRYLLKNGANPNIKDGLRNQNALENAIRLQRESSNRNNLVEQKKYGEIIDILRPVTTAAVQDAQTNSANGATHAALDAVGECLKLKAALKVCENIPWPASLGCNALAKSNYGNSYCPM